MITATVGFVGLGAMGAPMARRLLDAGHRLLICSRTPARAHALVTAGAVRVDTLRDLLAADVVIGCLLNTDAVRDVYLGPTGLARHTRPGQILIEHGTFDPALAVEIAEEAAARDARFLDAPVSGGPGGAADGTLATMVGGDPVALDRVTDLLDAYCATVVRAGSSGRGQMLKLINQLLVAVHAVASAEAAALIARMGIDGSAAASALMGGWAASTVLSQQLPAALAGDFDARGASVGKFAEVLQLVEGMAAGAGFASALLAPAAGVIRDVADGAHHNGSFASLITHYQEGSASP